MEFKVYTNPVKVMREFCKTCMGGSAEEIKKCTAKTTCPIYPWRFGKNPYRKKKEYTDEELAELRERMKKASESKVV